VYAYIMNECRMIINTIYCCVFTFSYNKQAFDIFKEEFKTI